MIIVTGSSYLIPAEVNSMLLVYVPAANVEVLKVMVEFVGVAPLLGLNVNQLPPVTAADQVVAGKELVMLNVWDAGLNPAIALRLIGDGLMTSAKTVTAQTLPLLGELKPITSTRQ